MGDVIKNRPSNQREISNTQREVYELSGAVKPTVRENKRGNDVSVKNDNVKDFTISISDIDSALFYYFRNVIQPHVIENGSKVDVPIIYSNAEMWKTAQKDGVFKDKEGRILLPVIAVKRESITKDRNLSNRLDGNEANLYYVLKKDYSSKNHYDKFSLLTNRKPVNEYHLVAIPDFVTVVYSCTVNTNYLEDMNKMVESIMFASDSFWGDPERFKFRAKIDTIPTTTDFTIGNDRVVKSVFQIEMSGYIIPDTINKDLATKKKMLSKAQIIFSMEAVKESETFQQENIPQPVKAHTATIIDSYYNQGGSSTVDINTLSYLNTNKELTASTVTSNTAIFDGGFLQAPTGLPTTGVKNFAFFVNGQYINQDHVISFEDNQNGTCTLVVDTGEFSFISSDEITAIGKFA